MQLLPAALDVAVAENPEFRSGLPRDYLQYTGIAHSESVSTLLSIMLISQGFICRIRYLRHVDIVSGINIPRKLVSLCLLSFVIFMTMYVKELQ